MFGATAILTMFNSIFGGKKKNVVVDVGFNYDAVNADRTYWPHWRNADTLTPDQLNNPLNRSILRSMARYEYSNNPWLFGLVNQVADDVIGTGARLQIEKESVKNTAMIEAAFEAWAAEVKLTEILKNVKRGVARDGEAFIMLTTREANKSKVKLFPLAFACDRVTSPINGVTETNNIDGVFIGHHHNTSTIIHYEGMALVYGLKTGQYDYHSIGQLGGTLVTLEGEEFSVQLHLRLRLKSKERKNNGTAWQHSVVSLWRHLAGIGMDCFRDSFLLHDNRHSLRHCLLQDCEGKLCPARQKGCAGVTITAAKKRTSTRNKTTANLHPFHLSIKQNKSCHEGTTSKTPVVPKAEVK